MTKQRTPTRARVVARTAHQIAWEDERAFGAYLDCANRALLGAIGAHPGDARKPWQRQACLICVPEWSPDGPRVWGYTATVMVHEPARPRWEIDAQELRFASWAPTWRAAIEGALGKAIEAMICS